MEVNLLTVGSEFLAFLVWTVVWFTCGFVGSDPLVNTDKFSN